MTLNLNVPKLEPQVTPRITVIGVGGAGGNGVNNMIQANLEGVDFVVMNTDAQALAQSVCERQIQLGRNITQGLGAGSRPDIGRAAAEEQLDDILAELESTHMVFITAGMGGGTGTGAAPVIARAAREAGMLTVGVVTKPFHFEGVHRMRLAEEGIKELQDYVDTLIIIPNQNLFRVANEKTTFADAFKMADDVLYSGVRGVTDLMVMPGLINLDFADIRSVMTEMGKAMMGTGEAEGERRAIDAAEAAISNPLLDDVSMKGARGVLINITGGSDLTLFEVDEAANRIRDEVDPEANIILGSTFDNSLDGTMRISVVATGIDAVEMAQPRPVTLSLVTDIKSVRGATQAAPAAGTESVAGQIASVETMATTTAPTQAEVPEEPAIESQGPEPLTAMAEDTPERTEGFESDPDSFMAPEPIEAEVVAEEPAATIGEAEPFAAAAIANATRVSAAEAVAQPAPTPAKRPRSLFARVTGAARAMQAEAEPALGHAEERAEPALRRDQADRPSGLAAGARRPSLLSAQASRPAAQSTAQSTAQAPAQAPAPAQAAAQPAPAAPTRARPAPATPARAEATTTAQAPASTPAATSAKAQPAQVRSEVPASQPVAPQPAAPQPAAQPDLSGLGQGSGSAASAPDEDLLDIPAFLRRQAN